MKNIRLAIVVAALMINSSLFAQDYAFKVLVNKGKNEVKTGDSWQPIKTGASLKSGDEVKLAENAYLGLIHATGKPLEVKDAGKHKVVDLAAKVGGGNDVLNKYTDFILSANTEKKNKLSATGAVHRGINSLDIYLPKPEVSFVYGNKVTLSWEKETAPYIVSFKSIFGDELDKVETNETTLTFDLNDPKFSNEDNILVEVYPKGKPNKKQDPSETVKRLSKADKERLKTAYNEFTAGIKEETALNKLYLAGFFEKNKLLIDAGSAYLEAIKLAPDVPAFQEAYNDFILRHGMKTPPPAK